MFRLANKKKSLMVEPEVEVIAVIEDENGATRFYNLELERKRVTYLTLSWTVVHPINAHSPFNGLTIEDIRKLDIELLITVKAFDTTFGSTVYSHYSYKSDEFIWGAKFVKIFHPIEGSDATRIELDKLNAYQPAEIKVLASEIS
jgi:inward rectifier potassium channel